MNILQKVGEKPGACPRCGAEGTVDLYFLSRPARVIIALGILAMMAGVQWDHAHFLAYDFGLMVFVLFGGWAHRAKCRSCGAGLAREIGAGWR